MPVYLVNCECIRGFYAEVEAKDAREARRKAERGDFPKDGDYTEYDLEDIKAISAKREESGSF